MTLNYNTIQIKVFKFIFLSIEEFLAFLQLMVLTSDFHANNK